MFILNDYSCKIINYIQLVHHNIVNQIAVIINITDKMIVWQGIHVLLCSVIGLNDYHEV